MIQPLSLRVASSANASAACGRASVQSLSKPVLAVPFMGNVEQVIDVPIDRLNKRSFLSRGTLCLDVLTLGLQSHLCLGVLTLGLQSHDAFLVLEVALFPCTNLFVSISISVTWIPVRVCHSSKHCMDRCSRATLHSSCSEMATKFDDQRRQCGHVTASIDAG